MRQRILSTVIYGLTIVIGLTALVYPFLAPSIAGGVTGQAHASDAPVLLTVLVGLCLVALLLEIQGVGVTVKFVSLLGVLVAMNSVLRFVEAAIPGPGGFSPIFFLIIVTGYVYGARFGFLIGALTLLVSALITGAVGPWLPYQMLTAGWVGMSAPLCRPLARWGVSRLHHRSEVVVLAAFAGLWGLAYGFIINIFFWPFVADPAAQHWEQGAGFIATVRRYAAFYLVTSLAWDAMRSAGNLLLTLSIGAPTIRVLRRFKRRFAFSYQPHDGREAPSAPAPAGLRTPW